MIRVNLLPFRLERKKENIRRQVSIFSLLIILGVLALTWYTLEMDKKIHQTQLKTQAVKAKMVKYREKAGKVTQIKKNLKILEQKLKVVASLESKRKEQLVLLESLPDQVVTGRMWIESIKSEASRVVIRGIAFDNPTIADFMKNLEASSRYSRVDLIRSKVKKMGDNLILKSFELVGSKKISEPENAGKKGK